MIRFELVRTDAPQPWHARFRAGNNRIVWTTEQYARRETATRAVIGLVLTFAQPASYDITEDGIVFTTRYGQNRAFAITEIDERS